MAQAAMMGDVDSLASPAAAIVLGRPVKCGTGACEMRARLPPPRTPLGSVAERQPAGRTS